MALFLKRATGTRASAHTPDYFFLAVVFILIMIGFAMLASASSVLGKSQFNDSYYYLKHQLLYGFSLGAAGFLVTYFLNYRVYRRFAMIFFLLSLGALFLVFSPYGHTVQNASRWVVIGPVEFQPAEFFKITYILYIAAWLAGSARSQRERNLYEGLIPFLIISVVMAAPLLLQPATSTVAILLFSGFVMYFVSGAPLRYLAALSVLGIAALAVLVFITPYRFARISGFFNKTENTQTINYQLNQATIAIGSGELWGVGYGASSAKVNYLPAAIDDSIFAIIAQEMGFVGAATIIVLFGMLTVRMLWLAMRIRDKFGRLVLIGFATIIGIQAIVNIGAISGLLPLTGVPLPFISYGGTALAVFLTMIGISANISKYA